MNKQKTYQDRLKNLDPRKAVERGRAYFSEKEYGEKLRTYSSRIGTKIVYYSLLLYYAFKSPDTPKKAKLTIAGALGYLILPVDVIPDFIPVVGFTDDSAVIIYAVYQVLSHIDEQVKEQAKARLLKIFNGQVDVEDLEDPVQKED
ncbi:YkvA family protein [Halobacillus litoralis]|uniref:YkvA family protein n=1 Tax=Halobacillus litoralis TaxID=45668 RepID=UPI001CFF29B9|nr:YkvA family protein [Halobacillus litoralis]WLR47972.1 YkvA family protein [Halobacillus litoralis]